MREILLDERKKISLDILLKIDTICEEYNLNYCLAYGSLIGAVRHSGFIPWDDDIDIWMPYEDYKKFEIAMANSDGYYLLKAFGHNDWERPFAKLCKSNTLVVDCGRDNSIKRGIAVDIFPLFKCKEKDLDKLVYFSKMINRTFLYKNGYVYGRLKKLIFKCLSQFGKNSKYYCGKFLKYANNLSGEMCFSASPYLDKDIHSMCLFECKRHEFEGNSFCIPEGYDSILKKLYGDYMSPPVESERVANHNVRAYWVDENIG